MTLKQLCKFVESKKVAIEKNSQKICFKQTQAKLLPIKMELFSGENAYRKALLRKLYHPAHKEKQEHHIYILNKNEHSQSWRTLYKMCLNKNSFDLLLISFVFNICISLKK